jgi:hypothetical protein
MLKLSMSKWQLANLALNEQVLIAKSMANGQWSMVNISKGGL